MASTKQKNKIMGFILTKWFVNDVFEKKYEAI